MRRDGVAWLAKEGGGLSEGVREALKGAKHQGPWEASFSHFGCKRVNVSTCLQLVHRAHFRAVTPISRPSPCGGSLLPLVAKHQHWGRVALPQGEASLPSFFFPDMRCADHFY